MQAIGSFRVIPELPDEIQRLSELAYNLYFSWSPDARQLFREIDPILWKQLKFNPVKFLQEVQQKRLEKFAKDPEYLSLFKKVMVQFDQYMREEKTWFLETFPEYKNHTVAYFSAEFGFHESLPIYSGGLGVLSGDHLKSASDLGLPLVGVSLFYYETYFTQQIDAHGNQVANYIPMNPQSLPLEPVLTKNGSPLFIEVQIASRQVRVRVWKVQVGRIVAYLLDSNVPENNPADRTLTARLYGGDQEMRISQEIILGMGGVKALEAIGIEPTAWHMNEGHSVFLALERIRQLVEKKHLKFDEALEAVAANTIFTTHTPVPAGNDAFPLDIKDKYFRNYWESVGIRRHQFMELGSQVQPAGYEIFNLTILSLKLSRFRNGVSKLHGKVSRELWKDVWPNVLPGELPITHITNGVHHATWTTRELQQLYDKYLDPDWAEKLNDQNYWKGILSIPDEELWNARMKAKERMLRHLVERLTAQYTRNKIGSLPTRRLNQLRDTNILTIGFARRFATYKRGTLIFKDPERLKKILNDPDRPVRIIFAGKAHPKDKGGQDLIRQIYNYSQTDGFRGKIFFVEGYDIHLARDLVSGVDVWLNNPIRPQEASGTSGQKVGLNGGLNFSVLDGWWVEGYNGKNGWGFGDQEIDQDLEERNSYDSEALYDILENEIVPLYYRRNEKGLPEKWIKMMKESLITITPVFNTDRMVQEYSRKMYIPAFEKGREFSTDNYKLAISYAAWREKIESNWTQVKFFPQKSDGGICNGKKVKYGEALTLKAVVSLGPIAPDEVKVQVFLTRKPNVEFEDRFTFESFEMSCIKELAAGEYLYSAEIVPSDSGLYDFAIRILPYHPAQVSPVELGLVRWYDPDEQQTV